MTAVPILSKVNCERPTSATKKSSSLKVNPFYLLNKKFRDSYKLDQQFILLEEFILTGKIGIFFHRELQKKLIKDKLVRENTQNSVIKLIVPPPQIFLWGGYRFA